MSHPARVSLRAPPHLPFVQGWPGIPTDTNRKGAGVHGIVEVRIGPNPIKAKWVRAEIRKFETPPPGFPGTETWEHVGEINTLWSAPAGKEWDNLEQADFKFYIPLPDNIPPSVEMLKNSGVRYELVAAVCYRQKGGVFKKESAPIIKTVEPIRITKHDLHSAWPIYNNPEPMSIVSTTKDIVMSVQRPSSAFGPTDRVLFTVNVKSQRAKPFKLKGFECSLVEIVMVKPIPVENGSKSKKTKGAGIPTVKTRQVAMARQAVDETIGKGGEKSARIDFAVPADKLFVTVRHSRSISIEYEMEVKAVFDGGVPELIMKGIKYTVGPFSRAHAQQAVRDIGFVPALDPRGPPPPSITTSISSRPTSTAATTPLAAFSPAHTPFTQTPSPTLYPVHTPSPQPPFPPNGFYGGPPRQPTQPIQGFIPRDMRRKSSGTSTMTTTTTTTFDQTAYHNHSNSNRPQSMQPLPSGSIGFPNAMPHPGLQRTKTDRTVDSQLVPSQSPRESLDGSMRYTQSDIGHGSGPSNRFSSGTTATFGMWDKDLRKAISKEVPVTSSPAAGSNTSSPIPQRGPPSAWLSAEQEKSKLYDEARKRAAMAQQSNGASLHDIGLDQLAPPPEYAPPRPEMPKEEYKAPSRPVSTYSPSPPIGAAKNGTFDSPPMPPSTTGSGGAQIPYLSAAEEKEQQRQRFEQAQRRVVSGPSGQISHQPAVAGSSSANQGYMSAAEEKEQQRRRFEEAQNKVVSRSSAQQSQQNVAAGSSSTNPVYMSAAEEKEQQRRRFEEAQNRVVSGSSGQQAAQTSGEVDKPIPYEQIYPAGSSSTDVGSSNLAPPLPPLSGQAVAGSSVAPMSEKEQMRRYYEAQDRVASASGSGSVTGSPNLAGNSGLRATIGNGPPPSGMSEKEQMRRYYEAQDRVASAGASSIGHAGPSSGAPTNHPSADQSAVSGNQKVPGHPVISEKEQMRRFYEAQDRVARAAEGAQSSPSRPTDITAPSYDSPPRAGPSGTDGPKSGSSGAAYMSAEEEKEMMRKRFENAQAAVERNKRLSMSPPPPAFDSISSAGPSGTSSQPPYMSAEAEKEMMRRRFEDAQAAVERNKGDASSGTTHSRQASQNFASPPESPGMRRDPAVIPAMANMRLSGGSSMGGSGEATGPPPPLPSKPPREYIDLLSPVQETGPGFAR